MLGKSKSIETVVKKIFKSLTKRVNFLAFLLIFLSVCVLVVGGYFADKKYGIFSSKIKKMENKKIIAFVSPAFKYKIVDFAKKYSLDYEAKISLNFLNEIDLEKSIASVEDDKASVVSIGYPIEKEEDTASLNVGNHIIAITNNAIQWSQEQESEAIPNFKNLCQMEKVLGSNNLPIFISNSFLPIYNYTREIYRHDCEKICDFLTSKIIFVTDSSSIDFVKSNSPDYMLISKNIVPEMLIGGDFTQRDVFGFKLYANHAVLASVQKYEQMGNAYTLMEIISRRDGGIVVENAVEIEEIKSEILENCKANININAFKPIFIEPNTFEGKDGVLFGLEVEVYDLGMKIYESISSAKILMKCQNPEDEVCKHFVNEAKTRLK